MSPDDQTGASCEMPRYVSHKKVWALKIAEITFDRDAAELDNRETDGSAIITPAEKGYGKFKVDAAYVQKHKPEVGGYYVVYADGYKSWSPAKAFEEGYTPDSPNAAELGAAVRQAGMAGP